MSLPVKKIYIDSQYRTPDSSSTSSFKFQLARNMYFPKNTSFYIEDVVVPHSWTTVEQGVNDQFYFRFSAYQSILGTPYFVVANANTTIPASNYTGATFATALQTALTNTLTDKGYTTLTPPFLTVTYSSINNNITIVLNALDSELRIPNDYDLALDNNVLWKWSGSTNSCNNLIGNIGNITNTYTQTNPFVSGMMNMDVFRCLYLSSPNLGTYTTLGSRGESNILKKIPVTSSYGMLIVDSYTSSHDFLDCSDQTLNTIEFNLKDVHGVIIPLHGSNISFSLVFAAHSEDGV
jgi:hypothetical protein